MSIIIKVHAHLEIDQSVHMCNEKIKSHDLSLIHVPFSQIKENDLNVLTPEKFYNTEHIVAGKSALKSLWFGSDRDLND